ncbi:MAG: DUF945 family protein [Pseudomonadota bacterium]|nr:DUF945 family protein [Pseudomonadota bacterium]
MNTPSKIAAAVAVLAVAYVGSSWWLGKQTEARYEAEVDRALTLLGPQLLVERRYDRGLFGATSQLVFQFALPAMPTDDEDDEDADDAADAQAPAAPQTVRLTLQSDVRHGPLAGGRPAAAVVRTHVVDVQGVSDEVRQAFAKAQWPEVSTVHGFAGTLSGQALLPAGEMQAPADAQGSRAQWQAVTWDFTVGAGGKRQRGTVRMPQLSMTAAQADNAALGGDALVTMRMEGLRASYDMTMQDGQWLMAPGKMEGELGLFEAHTGGDAASLRPLMALRDARLEVDTTQNGELFDIRQVVHGKGSVGEVAVEELRAESTLRRIDGAALVQAQALIARVLTAAAQDQQPSFGDDEVQAMMQRFMDARPAYEDRYSATLNGHTARLVYGLEMQEAPAQTVPGMPWMFAAVQRANMHADLHLPTAWLPVVASLLADEGEPSVAVQEMTQMADGFVQQGWLRKEGDAYVGEVRYGSGQLLINGKPLLGGGMPGR